EKLETFRPTLVIIDSLRRINAGREVSENSAEFADNIYQLKELCAQYNAACILIHHSNKNSEAVGVEKVRGSSAIAGAVWGVWELTQVPKADPNNKKKLIIDPKDPTRILSIIARDVEGQRLKIELDPENNHWINHGQQGISEEEVKEQKTHSAKVIELLKSVAPVGLEACEVNEQLSIGRGIYSTLNRLLGQKIIGSRPSEKDRRRTVYFCQIGTHHQGEDLLTVAYQQPGNPPPPTDTDPNVIEYAEPIDTYSVQSSITFDHNSIAFDHIPLSDPWDEQASNLEPESDTTYSIASTHSEWGRGQSTPDQVTFDCSELSHKQPVEQTPVEVQLPIYQRSDGWGFEIISAPVEQPATTSADDAQGWEVGQQVTVQTDVPSLKEFNGRHGVVQSIHLNCAQCLIKFSSSEAMRIPFGSLVRQTSQIKTEGLPFSSKSLPKKGDRFITFSGKTGTISAVSSQNPKYQVNWDNGQTSKFDLKDLEDLDARRI
ncbi:MAG: AAA family ATPase, partial [Coleofasciculus sp. Co-bin14]|nr:AAA family ATPase [Coleofasciculus sp. Co-bin14]